MYTFQLTRGLELFKKEFTSYVVVVFRLSVMVPGCMETESLRKA